MARVIGCKKLPGYISHLDICTLGRLCSPKSGDLFTTNSTRAGCLQQYETMPRNEKTLKEINVTSFIYVKQIPVWICKTGSQSVCSISTQEMLQKKGYRDRKEPERERERERESHITVRYFFCSMARKSLNVL